MEIVELLFHPLLLLSHKFNRPFPFITVIPLFKAASQEHNTGSYLLLGWRMIHTEHYTGSTTA